MQLFYPETPSAEFPEKAVILEEDTRKYEDRRKTLSFSEQPFISLTSFDAKTKPGKIKL